MENPHKVLSSMEAILSDSREWNRAAQLSAFAALKVLIGELKSYVEREQIGGWGYIQGKLDSLSFHVAALYGIDEDNGHDAHSHHVSALGDISAVRGNIPRG